MEEEDLAFQIRSAELRQSLESSGDLLEGLATKLQLSLPEHTTIKRSGLFSKTKPVKELTVRFPERHFQVQRNASGLSAQVMTVVRGVVLKSSEVSMDKWLEELSTQLNAMASESVQMRQILEHFVRG